MYCRKCGCEVEKNEIYCPHCSRKIKRAMWSISSLVITLLAALIVIVYSRVNQSVEAKAVEELMEEQGEREDLLPDVDEMAAAVIETIDPYAISSKNKTNYASEQLLDYTLYKHYEYDEMFSFGYPSSLYNQMSESDMERDGCFGRVIREVGLGCDDDSYVNFSLTVRIDGRSIEEMTDIVCDYESDFIYENEVLSKESGEDWGIVILKGYTSDETDAGVYNLIRIAPEYIYQMRIYFPAPRNIVEENHINYYLDTMYNLCGFSGHETEPRKYEEFLESQQN